MQVTTQRLSPVEMELQIAVPADIVKAEVDEAYRAIAKRAHVRGFRPGKAPRSVLTNLYGQQVATDVVNAIVNKTLPKALEEQNIQPVNTPSVETGKVDLATELTYKARFEVQPEITDVTWEGFQLTRPGMTVSEGMVAEQLEQLRKASAKHETPEPTRPAKLGDVVTVDFTLAIDAKEIPDGSGKDVQAELGSGQLLPELDTALAGRSVGDEVEAVARFPEQHPREEFRGKWGNFKLKLVTVKEKVFPEFTDEFVKTATSGKMETLDALRVDIRARIEQALKEQAEIAVAEQIVAKLNETNEVAVPASLVERQRQMMESEVAMQARRHNTRFTADQLQSLRESLRVDAEKKVRAGLLMAAIAKKHEIKITEADIDNGIAELAAETGKNVAKLKVEYREEQKRQILIGMILEDKILDLIESKATISDAPTPDETPEAAKPAEALEAAKPAEALEAAKPAEG